MKFFGIKILHKSCSSLDVECKNRNTKYARHNIERGYQCIQQKVIRKDGVSGTDSDRSVLIVVIQFAFMNISTMH